MRGSGSHEGESGSTPGTRSSGALGLGDATEAAGTSTRGDRGARSQVMGLSGSGAASESAAPAERGLPPAPGEAGPKPSPEEAARGSDGDWASNSMSCTSTAAPAGTAAPSRGPWGGALGLGLALLLRVEHCSGGVGASGAGGSAGAGGPGGSWPSPLRAAPSAAVLTGRNSDCSLFRHIGVSAVAVVVRSCGSRQNKGPLRYAGAPLRSRAMPRGRGRGLPPMHHWPRRVGRTTDQGVHVMRREDSHNNWSSIQRPPPQTQWGAAHPLGALHRWSGCSVRIELWPRLPPPPQLSSPPVLVARCLRLQAP